MLTFQIGLHIDDLFILEYIKNKLNCGHISISLHSLCHSQRVKRVKEW